MPRGQARQPGAPLTSGTRGFCIRASSVGIRGSPLVFFPPPSRVRAAPCVWRAVADTDRAAGRTPRNVFATFLRYARGSRFFNLISL